MTCCGSGDDWRDHREDIRVGESYRVRNRAIATVIGIRDGLVMYTLDTKKGEHYDCCVATLYNFSEYPCSRIRPQNLDSQLEIEESQG